MLVRTSKIAVVYMEGTPFQTQALTDVDLEVGAGEIVGLVGSTGSGKSTWMQTAAGLLDIHAGQVTYREDFDRKRLFTKIGLVFQMPEDQLFERTVLEDVSFGPRQLGWPVDRVVAASRTALTQVGLDPDTYGPRPPTSLSGGEKRRTAIAGILSMTPTLLLMDEPTAGLDAPGRNLFGQLVRSLHRAGTSVVLVTHDLEFLAGLATRIAIFRHGRKVADGPSREILGRADLLASHGLRAPLPVELLQKLKQRGLDVAIDALDVEEATRRIVAQLESSRTRPHPRAPRKESTVATGAGSTSGRKKKKK